jgi:metal-responsive CopG/Arc/MetJ family transcriptional regulator
MKNRKIRITLEIPQELFRALSDYAGKHTDGNLSAAVRRAIREVVK